MDHTNPIKYLTRWITFVVYLAKDVRIIRRDGKTLVRIKQGLEDMVTGETHYEFWRPASYWALRPRAGWFQRAQECGCTTRFGKPVYINMTCRTHMPDDMWNWFSPEARRQRRRTSDRMQVRIELEDW